MRGAAGVLLSGCPLVGAVALSGGGGRSAGPAASSASSSSSATPSTATPSTATPPTVGPSAADDLSAYFDAAASIDQRLKAAAVAANGAVGTTVITTTQATLDAIAAADPTPAANVIPAGLSPVVMRAVLTVQSDLVSRFYAFRWFGLAGGEPGRTETVPLSDVRARDILSCLGNGSPAASSFPADLAAARTAASRAPPLVAIDPSSQVAADLAIWLQAILEANEGCASCGGWRLTVLEPITWHQVGPLYPGGNPWDGDMGGILFTARYTAGQGWTIRFNAC